MGGDSVVVLRTIEHLDLSLIDPIVVAPPDCEVWQRFQTLADQGRIRLFPLEMGVVSHLEKGLPDYRHRRLGKVGQAVAFARAGLNLLQLIVRERIDVVYTMDRSRAVPLATLAARLLNRGLLFHGHCPWNGWGFAVRAAHQVVVITEYVRQEYARNGIDPDRVRVVYNGIDVEYYAAVGRTGAGRARIGVPVAAPMVLMPGRVSRYKGQLELVEAIPDVLRDVPDAQFVIAGGDSSELGDLVATGPSSMRAVLERRLAQLDVSDHVKFVKPTDPEMAELYADADVVVVPSWAEPFGLVVVEAMAAGTPVIGSDSGGIPESIVHGQTGLLVPPRDSHRLGQALTHLLGDGALRVALGRQGQARARRMFAIDRYVREMEDALLTVAGRGRQDPTRIQLVLNRQ
jgi:glycosyltransferase involved in cell wall biosynthesis